MPDDLKELQRAVKQVRQEPRRPYRVDWLILLARLTHLAMALGVLIVLGVAVSAIWPHVDQIKATAEGLLHPKPTQPPASQSTPSPIVGTNGPASLPRPPLIGGTSAPAPESSAEPIRTYRPGDIFAVGSWEYSITAADWQDLFKPAVDKTVWPEAGRKFLVLGVTVCNLGEETALLPSPRLVGLEGTTFNPTIKAGDGPAAKDPLSPDRHYKRQVVFDVPAGKPYKVLLSGGWLSDKQAVVEIGR